MGLQLPPELASLLAQAGGRWPQANEDRLHELADAWRGLAGSLDAVNEEGFGVTRRVTSDNQGASIDAFAAHEAEFRRNVGQAARVADATAAGVDGMARATIQAKLSIVEVLKAAWRAIKSFFGWIARFIGSLIKKVLSWVFEVVKWLLARLWQFVTWLVKQVFKLVAQLLRKIIDFLRRVLTGGKRQPKGPVPGKWNGKHPPKEAVDKVPKEWGEGQPNRKKDGWRWEDPNNQGNGVRIDKGDPKSSLPSQRVDHVVIRYNGRIIGPDGKPIDSPAPSKAEEAHIPLSEWLRWRSWNAP